MDLIIVSGLSGAGKTVALRQLEDLGYYCIDNLPLAIIGPMAKRAIKAVEARFDRLALGIDARESPDEIAAFPKFLDQFRKRGLHAQIIFLTATHDVLLQRYAETRRKHPLSSSELSLNEAIARERQLLRPIADYADHIIDTTSLNLHELRELVRLRTQGSSAHMAITIESFGFKNGVPEGLDFIFDVRCLPNPHWEARLRKQTGRDAGVAKWLSRHDDVNAMIDDLHGFLMRWLPAFAKQDRAYVSVGIGCTGGQHRSVYVVEQLAKRLESEFAPLLVRHRELVE
jgi:UPF0042 nucleotide-binding protein